MEGKVLFILFGGLRLSFVRRQSVRPFVRQTIISVIRPLHSPPPSPSPFLTSRVKTPAQAVPLEDGMRGRSGIYENHDFLLRSSSQAVSR